MCVCLLNSGSQHTSRALCFICICFRNRSCEGTKLARLVLNFQSCCLSLLTKEYSPLHEWLISLNMVSEFSYFWKLNNILLHVLYHFLPIHLLMDIWAAFIFQLFETMDIQTWIYKHITSKTWAMFLIIVSLYTYSSIFISDLIFNTYTAF